MKAIKLTFSLRDAKRGSMLLEQLGFQDQVMLTETFDLKLDEDQEDELKEELKALDLEFEIEEI